MKYLCLVLLAAVVVWRWRNASDAQRQDSPQPQPEAPPQTINMVACAHCGLHAPRNDMVQGTRGVYCSSAHCTLAEPS